MTKAEAAEIAEKLWDAMTNTHDPVAVLAEHIRGTFFVGYGAALDKVEEMANEFSAKAKHGVMP